MRVDLHPEIVVAAPVAGVFGDDGGQFRPDLAEVQKALALSGRQRTVDGRGKLDGGGLKRNHSQPDGRGKDGTPYLVHLLSPNL